MKVGDLISFRPINFGNEDWSNPCIVLKEYVAPDTGLFVIWCEGVSCVIDNENYEISYLTSS